ncbi:MAG: M48 family metallopeptidase [Pirellulales bacterium]
MNARLDPLQLRQLQHANRSSGYRLRAYAAILCLTLFFLFYVSLAAWMTFVTYRLLSGVAAGGTGAVAAFFAALPAGFISLFLWKALFFLRRDKKLPGVEIKAQDQPEFFAMLHELADQVGAPRVHRVFISDQVNAFVFYDLSILNLIFPTRKNLTVGLGLVNSLNRSEFIAVLAHEFGHFGQGFMAVGRWVELGSQIAGHIVATRDFLDRALQHLSHSDIRLAWIGWGMQIILWAIRSVVETAFKCVMWAQLALSREMEFQADRVAVSVAGSDAIVQALYRLSSADSDWRATVQFLNRQLAYGRVVRDPYVIQSRLAEHMCMLTGDPNRGQSPRATQDRVFEVRLAEPPRMWSTHPANTDREVNAKRVYLPLEADSRSAWTCFRDPEYLRVQIGKYLIKDIPFRSPPTELSDDEALKLLDEEVLIPIHDPKYRGVYVERRVAQSAVAPEHLVASLSTIENPTEALSGLYTDALHDSVMLRRNLSEELALLESLRLGFAEAPAGTIRHRGQTLRPSQLDDVVERVKRECDEVAGQIEQHDKQCRAVHQNLAEQIGSGWPVYYKSLIGLVHYADHAQADVIDAAGALANQLAYRTASGRLARKDRRHLIMAAVQLHQALQNIERNVAEVSLPPAVLEELKLESWRCAFNPYELAKPIDANLHQWMPVIDSWCTPMVQALGRLLKASVNELLRTEALIEKIAIEHIHTQGSPDSADQIPAPPTPAAIPAAYPRLLKGKDRARVRKLDWMSRFLIGDGLVPAWARLGCAASIVAAVLSAGVFLGRETVVIYNGLAANVAVTINGKTVDLGPNQYRRMDLGTLTHSVIETRSDTGELIERFEPDTGRGFATYVYNVSSAWPLVHWTAVYGSATQVPHRDLGSPQWSLATTDFVFEQPPASVSTKSGSATRTVMESAPFARPDQLTRFIPTVEQQQAMTRAHCIWDAPQSRHLMVWFQVADSLEFLDEVVNERLGTHPLDVPALRYKMDRLPESEQLAFIEKLGEQQHVDRENPDFVYLRLRAKQAGPEVDREFVAASKKWPSHVWLKNAAGLTLVRMSEFVKAEETMESLVAQRCVLTDAAALESARLHRFIARKPEAANIEPVDAIPLTLYRHIEQNNAAIQGTPLQGYYWMVSGDLQGAWQLAESTKLQDLSILTSLSVGADPAWAGQSLAIKPNDIQHEKNRYYLAAAAAARGMPFEPYLIFDEGSSPQLSTQFISKLRTQLKRSPAEVVQGLTTDDLNELSSMERGILITSLILYAPELAQTGRWRTDAETLLFVPERPYFGMP